MKIPPFRGTSSPEEYLEWVQWVEKIFEYQDHTEASKVKLAALEFTDYANLWWENLKAQRRREGEEPVNTWRLMERRFVPQYYKQELFLKMQTLRQGAYSVEDYVKEFEMLMIRCDLQEPQEQTIARFISGLHREIADVVELQPFVTLEDVIKLAVKVERHNKRGSAKVSKAYTSPSNYPTKAPSTPKESNPHPMVEKGKTKIDEPQPPRSRDIKCFKCLGRGHIASQCPNRKVMMVREASEEVFSEDEMEAELEEREGSVDVANPVEGELLVIRRTLSVQAKPEDEQRDNIFHTRCNVRGKVCGLIVDSGSCTNVASTTLVTKLNLATTKHPHPYQLQWLNNEGAIKVTEQVLIPFSIGAYKDEVICDVVPMSASHLLLGRPWQFDHEV